MKMNNTKAMINMKNKSITQNKNNWLKRIGFFFLLLVVIYLLVNKYVDVQLEKRVNADAYQDCFKVWATRGLVKNKTEEINNVQNLQNQDRSGVNSISSIQAAFDAGARGTEVDLFYDAKMDRYIISHNYPYFLKDGGLLTLEDLFNATGGANYYWIDFKKLRYLSKAEIKQAVSRLEAIVKDKNLKPWIYIEGADPVNLSSYSKAGFKTLFDVHPLTESEPLTRFIANVYKMAYYFGGFTVMGMKHGEEADPVYGETARKALGNVPLFIYHTPNSPALLKQLSSEPQVRVILNRDDTANNYLLNSCE